MASSITRREELESKETKLLEPLLSDPKRGGGNKMRRKLQHSRTAPRLDLSLEKDIDGLKHTTEKYGGSFSFSLVAVTVLIFYLAIGSVCFYFLEQDLLGTKTNTLIDVLYFCIVTMTTVGYGDLVPQSVVARLFTCAYVFLGFGLMAWLLSSAANSFLERQELLLLNAISRRRSSDNVEDLNETRKAKWKVVMSGIIFVALFGVGLIVLMALEGMTFVQAFYCICITVTTLGYGDLSFQTSRGRAFAIVWILVSTINVAQLYLYIAELYTERKRSAFVKWVLARKTTFADLEAADMDNDRLVSASEFIVYKLKEMGKIESHDVVEILREFDTQDIDRSGSLSKYDLNLAQ